MTDQPPGVPQGIPPVPPVAPPVSAQPVGYAPPPAGYAPRYAPPPAGPRRLPLWPFLLGGGALLLLIVIGIVVAFFVGQLAAATQAESDRETVEAMVVAFDEAYEDADCDDYEAVTSSAFRDSAMQESDEQDFDCDVWEEGAESLTVGGEYVYVVEVYEVAVDGDTATVQTIETLDGEPLDYLYGLERSGAGWVIVSYESL